LQEGHNLTVLQVTPELNAGGVERTTLEIAEAISRAGGLALVATAGGRLEPDLKTAGGELIRIPAASKNPITLIANAFKLAKIARERNVQIIHARSRAPAWSALARAGMERAARGAHGERAIRDDLSRHLQCEIAAESVLQFDHGARRRDHRQL